MFEDRIPCRCLLDEKWPELRRVVREYVELLPDAQRVPDDVYRARLKICGNCENLRDGTCGLCGCYVEARAAKRGLGCPDIPAKWGKMQG